MGAQPTTERGRRTRERITTAAAELVAEKGAQHTSLDDVGARAAASRSQLYHYFDDKSDLLRAVAESTNDLVVGAEADLLADIRTWDDLTRWAEAHMTLGTARAWKGGCPMANLLGQLGESDDAVRAALSEGFDRWEEHIRAGIEAMVASGELRSVADPAALAAATLATLQGGLLLSQARRDPRPLRGALDGALGLIAIYRRKPARRSATVRGSR